MKPAAWYLNVLRRTLVALVPGLARPDDAFAERWLPEAELGLYRALDPRDREHACRVAKRLLARRPDAAAVLVRAALLHDVGKLGEAFNPLYRIAAHLWAARLPAEPRLGGLRGALQTKLHHDRYGAALIRSAGGGERVATLVARHHRPGDDADARLLRDLDERT